MAVLASEIYPYTERLLERQPGPAATAGIPTVLMYPTAATSTRKHQQLERNPVSVLVRLPRF